MVATVIAISTHSLTVLIAASALQGVGTGVGGVMARTLPRDMYRGTQLRHANSLLNMGILVSPLLAPLIGGLLDTMWSRAPVTPSAGALRDSDLQHGTVDAGNAPAGRAAHEAYRQLQNAVRQRCVYLLPADADRRPAGIAVFEACSGVLLGAGLGLSSMVVSILFILPIPAAFFGARFAGRQNKRFSTLMWQAVISCLLAGLMMWIPAVWRDDRLDAADPGGAVLLRRGDAVPLATSGAMEPFPFLAGTAGALVGGLQNIGSGALAWLSAMMPQTGQASLGLLMTLMGLLILLCWLPLASRVPHHEQPV